MTVEEKLQEVLSRNVKDEDIRTGIYEYCMMTKTEFHVSDYTSKYNYDLQKTRTVVIVLLDNIESEMLTITEYACSLIKKRLSSLNDFLQDMFVFQALSEVAEFNENTGIWTLKEEV